MKLLVTACLAFLIWFSASWSQTKGSIGDWQLYGEMDKSPLCSIEYTDWSAKVEISYFEGNYRIEVAKRFLSSFKDWRVGSPGVIAFYDDDTKLEEFFATTFYSGGGSLQIVDDEESPRLDSNHVRDFLFPLSIGVPVSLERRLSDLVVMKVKPSGTTAAAEFLFRCADGWISF